MRSTFELIGRDRIGSWPAKRMMTLAGSWAKGRAGGGLLERRPHHFRTPRVYRPSIATERHYLTFKMKMPSVTPKYVFVTLTCNVWLPADGGSMNANSPSLTANCGEPVRQAS